LATRRTTAGFDDKLGADFLSTVPRAPGVYEWLGAQSETLYVGKAKDLRKRLGQYRTATRRKATRKQWDIVRASTSLRFQTVENELAALLKENELIQTLRPPLNVSGAFEFLYPAIGLRRREHELDLVCTTSPEPFAGFTFTGVFRSPALTRAAFDALVELLAHVGHVEPSKRVTDLPKVPYSRVVRLRRLPTPLDAALLAFLHGEGKGALRPLVLALVERPGARRHTEETQQHLALLARFSLDECEPLREVRRATGRQGDAFLSQGERDRVFLVARGVLGARGV
jgi:predicted GIY-YIG superfamily endonuclease